MARCLRQGTGWMIRRYLYACTGHKHTSYKLDSGFTPTDSHVVSGSEDGVLRSPPPAWAQLLLDLLAPAASV